MPTFAEEKYHEITAGSLREMIRRTIFAAADETARYSMTGVLWELDDDTARLVATDGQRLALAQGTATAHGGHTTKGQTPVVPTKAMSLLERNLQDDPEETVKICLRPNEVLFRTGRAVIYSRLVEGRFPDYRQVLPKKPAREGAADGGAVPDGGAAGGDHDGRRTASASTFRFAKNKLTLEAQGATTGRSKVELPHRVRRQADRHQLRPAVPDRDAQGAAAGRGADAGPDRRRQRRRCSAAAELLVSGDAVDVRRTFGERRGVSPTSQEHTAG